MLRQSSTHFNGIGFAGASNQNKYVKVSSIIHNQTVIIIYFVLFQGPHQCVGGLRVCLNYVVQFLFTSERSVDRVITTGTL